METILLPQFSAEIRAHGRDFSLNFKKVDCPKTDKFFVTVLHNNRSFTSFEVVRTGLGQWDVIPPAYAWFIEHKAEIIEIIRKNG